MIQRPQLQLDAHGRLLGLTGAGLCLVGLAASSPIALLLGQLHLAALLSSLVHGAIKASRALRSLGAAVASEGPLAAKALSAGGEARFTLALSVDDDVEPTAIQPIVGVGLSQASAHLSRVSEGSYEVVVEATAVRAGRTAIHGLRVRLAAFPWVVDVERGAHALAVVLPRPTPQRLGNQRSGDRVTLPVGLSRPDTQGLGSDVRELRDHVPGDPFKHIAWKASARRGRLIVKEFDDDGALSVYLVVDMGPALRKGPWGATALDSSLSQALGMARQLTAGHHRVGLVTADGHVHDFVRADAGPTILERLVETMLRVQTVVDARLTEASTEEVAARVAHFLWLHHNVDVRLPAPLRLGILGPDVDVERAADVARRLLPRYSTPRSAAPAEGADADTALRLFCERVGLDLPYRAEFGGAFSGRGLVEAVERCILDRSANHLIVALVDPATLDLEIARVSQRLARAHGHRMSFVPVAAPAAGPLQARGLEGGDPGEAGPDLPASHLSERVAAVLAADSKRHGMQIMRGLRLNATTRGSTPV